LSIVTYDRAERNYVEVSTQRGGMMLEAVNGAVVLVLLGCVAACAYAFAKDG